MEFTVGVENIKNIIQQENYYCSQVERIDEACIDSIRTY